MFVCIQHNTDYVITACMGGFFRIAEPSFGKAILSAAYSPYGGGAPCRWR